MEVIFTFHNTPGAINGERALVAGGLKVTVMALPPSLGAGCGLCLRVAPGDLDDSRRLLKEAAISPQAVYIKHFEDGNTIYAPLEEQRKL